MQNKQYRSLMFVPASRVDMASRAHQRGADAIILDLEDGVAANERPAARKSLPSLIQGLQDKGQDTIVRINALAEGGELDIAAIPNDQSPPLMIPKVTSVEQLTAIEKAWVASGKEVSDLQLYAMIECPQGMFRSEQIAAGSSYVSALVFGSEDFSAEAGTSANIDALAMPAQWVALAAAAAGVCAYGIPGSIGNYHDMDLFETTSVRAKAIGFTGTVCVHPKQVAIANSVFQPTAEEIAWAKAVIAQSKTGPGATGGDVGMVDAPVIAQAEAILQRAEQNSEQD